ncbi:MAG TPA: F0F1 ATP synthase subunit delta [Streptosporangiaceae bacterium]|nr:F0F1 ATP synthase subunit delta [Streptosporangiaceae bacterium]
MRGISRASLAEVKEHLTAALAGRPAADGTAMSVGDELFAVVRLLDREHALRRALSNPAKPGEEKAAVAEALLGGKVSPATAEITAAAVRLRWSSPRDLTDGLEQLAVAALVTAADAQGKLDDLEDGLFRFGRVVAAQPELRLALSNPLLPPERKHDLLTSLLARKVTDVSLRLISEAAEHPRGRSLESSLEEYARLAAERRERVVAIVRTATELSAAQRGRLVTALAAVYGHEVHLNVVIDARLVGGLSVQVGDEVIDGTVVSRLETARRRLAS